MIFIVIPASFSLEQLVAIARAVDRALQPDSFITLVTAATPPADAKIPERIAVVGANDRSLAHMAEASLVILPVGNVAKALLEYDVPMVVLQTSREQEALAHFFSEHDTAVIWLEDPNFENLLTAAVAATWHLAYADDGVSE